MDNVQTISGPEISNAIAALPTLMVPVAVSQLPTRVKSPGNSAQGIVNFERNYEEMTQQMTTLEQRLQMSELKISRRLFELYMEHLRASLRRQKREVQILHHRMLHIFAVAIRRDTFEEEFRRCREVWMGFKSFLEDSLHEEEQGNHGTSHQAGNAGVGIVSIDQPIRTGHASSTTESEARNLVNAMLPFVDIADIKLLVCLYHFPGSDQMNETLDSCLQACTELREVVLSIKEMLHQSNFRIVNRGLSADMRILDQKLKDQFNTLQKLQDAQFTRFLLIKPVRRVDKLLARITEARDFALEIKVSFQQIIDDGRTDDASKAVVPTRTTYEGSRSVPTVSATVVSKAVAALLPLVQTMQIGNLIYVSEPPEDVKRALDSSQSLLRETREDLTCIFSAILNAVDVPINWDLVLISAESLRHKLSTQIEVLHKLKTQGNAGGTLCSDTHDGILDLQESVVSIRGLVACLKYRFEEQVEIEVEGTSPLSITRSPSIQVARPGYGDYKVFISHAGKDKWSIAIPLWETLQRIGVRTFLDKMELQEGDDAPESMVTAMNTAAVVVFVLSREFAAKKWPMKELCCFQDRRKSAEDGSGPVMIPLFYRLDVEGCSDERLFTRTEADGRNVFAEMGFLDRVEREEVSMRDTREQLERLAKQTGIENEEMATNEESEMMQVRRERLIRRSVDAVVKALTRLEGVAPTFASY